MYGIITLRRRSVFACSPVLQPFHSPIDLTVEMFLLAFRRFTGRRSLPQIVASDNTSTYQAAPDGFYNQTISETLWEERCTVEVYPAASPWYMMGVLSV